MILESQIPSQQKKRNFLSVVGLLLLLVPLSIWALWIAVFYSHPGVPPSEKMEIFNSWLPSFLRSDWALSLLILGSATGSIVFTSIGRKKANKTFRVVGIFVIIVASLIILMELFSML